MNHKYKSNSGMFAQANNMLEELLFLAVITGGQNAYQAFESAFCTLGQLCDRYGFECRIIGSGINGSQLFGGLSDGDAVIFVPENEDLSEFFGELAETFQCDVKQNRTLGNLFEMKFQDENGNNLDIDLVLVCENPIDGVVDAAVDDRCIVSLATECPELQSAVMPLICDKFNRYYAPFDGLATQDTKYFITFNETSQELMTGMMEMLRADQILWAVFCFLKIWMRSGILPPISTAALACAVVGGYNAMSVNFSSRTDSVRKMFVTMAGVLQFLRAMSKLVTMDAHFDDEGRPGILWQCAGQGQARVPGVADGRGEDSEHGSVGREPRFLGPECIVCAVRGSVGKPNTGQAGAIERLARRNTPEAKRRDSETEHHSEARVRVRGGEKVKVERILRRQIDDSKNLILRGKEAVCGPREHKQRQHRRQGD